MEDLLYCPLCKFWKPELVILSCCGVKYCPDCHSTSKTCFSCRKPIAHDQSSKPYIAYQAHLNSLLRKCRHAGCNKMYTEVMLKHHEEHCEFGQVEVDNILEVLSGGEVESKTTLKAKSRANLMRSFFAVNPVAAIRVNGGSTQYVDHVVVATDTLQGIALRYGVTVQEIKSVNRLAHDASLHERSVLRIPLREIPKQTIDADELEAFLRRRLIQRFKRTAKCSSDEEAQYYLSNACYDIDAAILQFQQDMDWEKENAHRMPRRLAQKHRMQINRSQQTARTAQATAGASPAVDPNVRDEEDGAGADGSEFDVFGACSCFGQRKQKANDGMYIRLLPTRGVASVSA